MSRDAVRVVDQVERRTLRRVFGLLDVIDADLRDLIRGLDLSDTTTRSRVFRELRARQAVAQSKAARDLLSMGRADGPIAVDFRAGIREAMQDGVQSATRAAAATGVVTSAEAAAAVAFGARIDLPLLAALTESTITTLDRVSADGVQRLTDEIARGAIRGDGPRATARRARAAVDLTRYEAERIVRTVFMRANNEARHDQFTRLGVDHLQWDATNDARTCQYCAARHGVVWKLTNAPRPPAHPHCRCVMLPWRPDSEPANRGDSYYERTRASMAERLQAEGRTRTTATAAAPFERNDGTPPPKPVWAPGRGFL